jgi:hypothetical protein
MPKLEVEVVDKESFVTNKHTRRAKLNALIWHNGAYTIFPITILETRRPVATLIQRFLEKLINYR